jgi:hypothetical protein
MQLSELLTCSWFLAAFLIAIGLAAAIHAVWQSYRQVEPGSLTAADRRYLRIRGALRISAGVLLVVSGVLLAYIGAVPLDQLEFLANQIRQAPERARELRTPENQAAITRAMTLVMLVGGCALVLIGIALTELFMTWIYGWRKRYELHQARQAYLAQQALVAQQARGVVSPSAEQQS